MIMTDRLVSLTIFAVILGVLLVAVSLDLIWEWWGNRKDK